MNRTSAGAIHFALSVAVAAMIFTAVFLLWYPGDLFESAGGRRIFFLIAGVDVALGPLLTFIIYKPGKPGLRFDLWTIGIVQGAALAAGVWVLAQSRPVYIVYVVDRFELMRANDYPEAELARAASSPYTHFPWGRPRIVGAVMPPNDPRERERIAFLAPTGVDLQHMPQHYTEYANVGGEVGRHAKSIAELRRLNPSASARIDDIVRDTRRPEDALGFLPMRAGDADLAVIVDRPTNEVLRIARLNPWEK